MRRLLFAIAVLLVAFILVWAASEDPGYVLIARSPWSVEMPLTLFSVLVIVGVLATYLVGRLIARGLKIPADVAGWRSQRLSRQARSALTEGLAQLAACNWQQAESRLLEGLRYSDSPMINYLGAAIASQGQNDIKKRDNYLAQAGKAAPKDSLAPGMTQALLQHQAKQQEQALATLTSILNRNPENREALKLLQQTYLELRDWTGIVNLLPDLKKYNALQDAPLEKLEIDTYKSLLTLSLPSGSAQVLQKAWTNVPKSLQAKPELIGLYAGKLIDQGEHDEAEKLLRKAIEQGWNSALVRLYGKALSQNIGRQLETARSWMISHPKDADLLTCLGELALENGDGGAATEFLQKSLDLRQSADTYFQLGRAYESENKNSEAMNAYRRGLALKRT